MNLEKAKQYRDKITYALNNLSVEDALLEPILLFPTIEHGRQYATGNYARVLGALYVCVQDHTATEECDPNETNEYWVRADSISQDTHEVLNVLTDNLATYDSDKEIPDDQAIAEILGYESDFSVDDVSMIRTELELLTSKLDDMPALEVVELSVSWKPNTHYFVGNRVRHEGELYKCLIEHDSQDEWIPVNSPSIWAKVLIPDDNVIPEWEQPLSTNAYAAGDKVTHNGSTWISDIDNNVWEPGIYGWTNI